MRLFAFSMSVAFSFFTFSYNSRTAIWLHKIWRREVLPKRGGDIQSLAKSGQKNNRLILKYLPYLMHCLMYQKLDIKMRDIHKARDIHKPRALKFLISAFSHFNTWIWNFVNYGLMNGARRKTGQRSTDRQSVSSCYKVKKKLFRPILFWDWTGKYTLPRNGNKLT